VQEMMDQVAAATAGENQIGIQQIQDAVASLDHGMEKIIVLGDEVSAVGERLLNDSHALVQVTVEQKKLEDIPPQKFIHYYGDK